MGHFLNDFFKNAGGMSVGLTRDEASTGRTFPRVALRDSAGRNQSRALSVRCGEGSAATLQGRL